METTDMGKYLKKASNMMGFAFQIDTGTSIWKVELAGKDENQGDCVRGHF